MSKNYNTRTASLKATTADIRILDAKNISLDGKNILDYISDSEFNSYDTRDPLLKNDELDIWNTKISLSDNGCIEVKPKEHTVDTISQTQSDTIKSAVKVINNEVLGDDDAHLMYWLTDGLTDGYNTLGMLHLAIPLISFSSNLSSLVDGNSMFNKCYSLESFSGDLSSLIDGRYMFNQCSSLTSFNGDLSSLINGSSMFSGCSSLTTFDSDLSKLTTGDSMFKGTKLDAPSLANIIHTINTPTTNGSITIGLGIDDTDEARQALAEAIWCNNWDEVNLEFANKNWTVTWQFNGAPVSE